MKKILLLAVAAMMATVNANAWDDNVKQEVGISYGVWSNSDIINAYETIGTNIFGASTGDEHFVGPIGLEYFYHLNSWFSVGGIGVYGQMHQDLFLTGKKNGKGGEIKNLYLTLMPAMKFDWVRKSHFGVYSKLGIGATLRNEKVDYDASDKDDYNDTEVHVNWQVSLLGLEAGGNRLRGFLEIGTGEQGIFDIGLRYKF
jgi:hypothetical protein